MNEDTSTSVSVEEHFWIRLDILYQLLQQLSTLLLLLSSESCFDFFCKGEHFQILKKEFALNYLEIDLLLWQIKFNPKAEFPFNYKLIIFG